MLRDAVRGRAAVALDAGGGCQSGPMEIDGIGSFQIVSIPLRCGEFRGGVLDPVAWMLAHRGRDRIPSHGRRSEENG